MSFSLKSTFKYAATAMATMLGLAQPSPAQEFENFADMAKHTWQTLADANELESPTRAAIQLLTDATADMTTAFDSSVLFIRPANDGSAFAQFITVGDNNDVPVIILYNNPTQAAFHHAYVQHVNQDAPNIPSYDEYLTVHIALSLSNEIAHLRQFHASPEQFAHITSTQNPNFCADTMALEKSSDDLMIQTAQDLFEHFKTLPPDTAQRMNIALNDALFFSGFANFLTYAHNPSNDSALKSFEISRDAQYSARKECPPNGHRALSPAAQNAIKNVLRSL